jgi:MOSC domain-containing protein YiiM
MKLFSINIGKEQTQQNKNRVETTGIYKMPVHVSVEITPDGIESDVVCDTKHHGGPDQAVYVYGDVDYDWWSKELGRELAPGTFGENLTISGLESAQFDIGDFIHIGAVILQVTAPRIPCGTFAARMGDPQWVKKFRKAERPGLYCRVIQQGIVAPGDAVTIEKFSGKTISILQMYRDYYEKDKSMETLQQHLAAPIAVRARKELEEQLQKLAAE